MQIDNGPSMLAIANFNFDNYRRTAMVVVFLKYNVDLGRRRREIEKLIRKKCGWEAT